MPSIASHSLKDRHGTPLDTTSALECGDDRVELDSLMTSPSN